MGCFIMFFFFTSFKQNKTEPKTELKYFLKKDDFRTVSLFRTSLKAGNKAKTGVRIGRVARGNLLKKCW